MEKCERCLKSNHRSGLCDRHRQTKCKKCDEAFVWQKITKPKDVCTACWALINKWKVGLA